MATAKILDCRRVTYILKISVFLLGRSGLRSRAMETSPFTRLPRVKTLHFGPGRGELAVPHAVGASIEWASMSTQNERSPGTRDPPSHTQVYEKVVTLNQNP